MNETLFWLSGLALVALVVVLFVGWHEEDPWDARLFSERWVRFIVLVIAGICAFAVFFSSPLLGHSF